MIIYKTRWFNRWARKQELSNRALREAVREMQAGLFEADLGGGLLKKRIVRSNIDKDEEEALKKLASHLLSLSPPALSTAHRADELMEVDCDAQD